MDKGTVEDLALRLADAAKDADSGRDMLNLLVSTVGAQEFLRKRWEQSGFPSDEFQGALDRIRADAVQHLAAEEGPGDDEDEGDAAAAVAAAAVGNPGECSACEDTERWIRGAGQMHMAKRLQMVIPILSTATCCDVHLAMGVKIAHALRGSLANFAAKKGSLERVQEIADKLPDVAIDHIQMTQPSASNGDLN